MNWNTRSALADYGISVGSTNNGKMFGFPLLMRNEKYLDQVEGGILSIRGCCLVVGYSIRS